MPWLHVKQNYFEIILVFYCFILFFLYLCLRSTFSFSSGIFEPLKCVLVAARLILILGTEMSICTKNGKHIRLRYVKTSSDTARDSHQVCAWHAKFGAVGPVPHGYVPDYQSDNLPFSRPRHQTEIVNGAHPGPV